MLLIAGNWRMNTTVKEAARVGDRAGGITLRREGVGCSLQ